MVYQHVPADFKSRSSCITLLKVGFVSLIYICHSCLAIDFVEVCLRRFFTPTISNQKSTATSNIYNTIYALEDH